MDLLLKIGHARTVIGRGDAVVKRFHHPSPIYRLRDGRRARREYELLHHFHGLGLAVPRPRAIVNGPEGWEVTMERLPGTSLEVLLETGPGRARLGRSAVEGLGRLLARAGSLGLDHPDLHAGNVLLAGDGGPFLVDLHGARVRRPRRRRLLRDLGALYQVLREVLDPDRRRAFVEAWCASLETPPGEAEGLLLRLEERAPRERRRRVEAGLARWTRPSGLLAQEGSSGRLLRRRGPDLEALEAEGRALCVQGAEEAVREAWLAAARLFEHRLPTVVPAALELRGRASRAWLEAPAGARPDAPGPRAEACLAAALRDRRLAPGEALAGRLVLPDGSACFAPP